MKTEVRGRGLRLERSVSLIRPGLLRIAQEITVSAAATGLDVSGPYWMCGLVRVFRGSVEYHDGGRFQELPWPSYGIFLPPFSIAHAILRRSRTFSAGYLGTGPLPLDAPRQPVIFQPVHPESAAGGRRGSQRLPASSQEVFSLLARARRFQEISRVESLPTGAQRLKDALDKFYAQPLRIGHIAQSLRIHPALASRNFRRAYHMTPSQYRQALRVLESMMRLAQGQPIIGVSGDVGFGDLSRFYQLFRRIACAPPGRYRPRESKIAKTQSA